MEEEILNKKIESVMQEYTEVCQFLRHFSNLRFAILTVYFAILAGMILVSFNINILLQFPSLTIMARIASLFITIIFWMFAERTFTYGNHLTKRAIELEQILGYSSLQFRPKSFLKFINMINANRLLYFIIALFWIYSLFI